MMTSPNGSIFRVTGPLCGEFTGPGEFPTQRPVTRSFDVFFDLRPNKRLSKQSWSWWFETLSRPLWHHCNGPSLDHLQWVGVGGFSEVLATFNHVDGSFNLFIDVCIIAFFRIWDYVLHVEHVSCVITNWGQHQWIIPSPLSIAF